MGESLFLGWTLDQWAEAFGRTGRFHCRSLTDALLVKREYLEQDWPNPGEVRIAGVSYPMRYDAAAELMDLAVVEECRISRGY